jgi:hypothetical protein
MPVATVHVGAVTGQSLFDVHPEQTPVAVLQALVAPLHAV